MLDLLLIRQTKKTMPKTKTKKAGQPTTDRLDWLVWPVRLERQRGEKREAKFWAISQKTTKSHFILFYLLFFFVWQLGTLMLLKSLALPSLPQNVLPLLLFPLSLYSILFRFNYCLNFGFRDQNQFCQRCRGEKETRERGDAKICVCVQCTREAFLFILLLIKKKKLNNLTQLHRPLDFYCLFSFLMGKTFEKKNIFY